MSMRYRGTLVTPIDSVPLWDKSTEQCRISGGYHVEALAVFSRGDIAVVLESSYSSEFGWWEHRVLFGELTGWVMSDQVKLVGE